MQILSRSATRTAVQNLVIIRVRCTHSVMILQTDASGPSVKPKKKDGLLLVKLLAWRDQKYSNDNVMALRGIWF